MTASLPPVQPASAQPATAASSASDSAAPDVPFSQVLSGEIAQQRGRSADAPGKETDPAADTPPTTEAQPASESRPAADTPAATRPSAEWLASHSAEPIDPATGTPAADTLLALALNPELQKPIASRQASTDGDADDIPANGRSLPGIRADAASRSAAHAAWADARNGRADALAQSAEAAGAGDARHVVADALAARVDGARAERQSDFMAALNQVQASQAQASQVQTTQAASTAATPLQASDRLNPPLGTPAWNQALGEKIVWMAAGSQQSATLTLNPPDLGPLQVVLNVSNDQASAHFFAAQPEVRQALEAALPRLREMMQDAGIQLGQANVSADTARQQDNSPRDTPRQAPGFSDAGADTVAEASLAALPARTGRGLVDTFA